MSHRGRRDGQCATDGDEATEHHAITFPMMTMG